MAAFLDELITLPMPILLILMSGIACWRFKEISRGLLAAGTGLLFLFSLPIFGQLLLKPLFCADELHDMSTPHPAAIVVPTGGIFNDGTGQWWASGDSIRRVTKGLQLQAQYNLPLILVGGNPNDGQPAESTIIARQLKLPEERVIVEPSARNSFETGQAVARIVQTMPSRRVVLVTSDVHMARMMASLHHAGLEVVTVPVENRSSAFQGWTDFVPSHRGLSISNAAIREYAAILWYVVTGKVTGSDLAS